MIISDGKNHKIDATFADDGFLHVTVFHLKSNTEWVTKMFGLSPDVQCKLVDLINEKANEKD